MFVPGHNEKLLKSASKSTADAILFDVEDSVQPPANKLIARKLVVEYSHMEEYDRFSKFVRLNEINTEFFLQDVIQLTEAKIDGFLLSKTDTPENVIYLDNLLTSLERDRKLPQGHFKIIPILETTKSIVNVKEISKSSNRIIAIGFGSEDFVSDLQGIRDFDTNVSLFTPRSYVAIVARSFGLEAIDAAYIKIHDLEGLEKHLEVGKTLGYGGMWILHPKQNSLANLKYAPTKEEYEEAKSTLLLYDEAIKQNKGVAIINGKFIGPPLVIKANSIIENVDNIISQGKELNYN